MSDPTPSDPTDPLSNTLSSRYIPGRPATQNPNPRGKHHRNPLPWKRSKLCAKVWDMKADAKIYREHLWSRNRDGGSDGGSESEVEGKTETKRPRNAHILTLMEAHAKRNRVMTYYFCRCFIHRAREGAVAGWKREVPLLGREGKDEATWAEESHGEGWDETDGDETDGDETDGDETDGDGVVGGWEDVVCRGLGYRVKFVSGRGREDGVGSDEDLREILDFAEAFSDRWSVVDDASVSDWTCVGTCSDAGDFEPSKN